MENKIEEKQTVGVIGLGMVGGAVYKYFKENGYEVHGFSKTAQEDKQKTLESNTIFVCVPTPFDWDNHSFNGSILKEVLEEIPAERVVVIKSTMPIGSTEELQGQFPELYLLFNPEFLSEATAYGDFVNPDRQFVGYTKESYSKAMPVLDMLPESPYGILLPAKEAELLKYINNLHGALAVIEANHYYDVCQKVGLNYERVIKASHASKWVGAPMGRQYHNVNHKGFRGFGGTCFPKDINAYLEWCDKNGIEATLFKIVRELNKSYLSAQNMSEADAEKK